MSRGIDYYKNLITSEHRDKPKFMAWLTAVLQVFIDVQTCAESLSEAFDVDHAVGVQLDIVGAQIGAKRTVSFQPTGSVSPVLDDDTYRILIKATIARNHWDGKMASFLTAWEGIFPGGRIRVQDNLDMSVDVTLSGVFTSIVQDLISHDMIVPRPEGVKVNYYIGTEPFFGFNADDTHISGFDGGHWV
jgi:hypothetical protein